MQTDKDVSKRGRLAAVWCRAAYDSDRCKLSRFIQFIDGDVLCAVHCLVHQNSHAVDELLHRSMSRINEHDVEFTAASRDFV